MKDNSAAVHAQVPVEVASFLLNEKRSEIAKIELQQRINVLLVPNKSLETPHYKLERLKHDDPRLDRIEASYKMAEEIEDATTVTRRSQEPTNKQTPVIKGVLPDAPAPIAPTKPEVPAANAKPAAKAAAPVVAPAAASGGFFGWLKSLFGGNAAEPVAAPAVKKDEKAREGRREGGREGGRESGRDGRRGGRRGERSEGATSEVRAPREGGRRGEGRVEGREGDGRPARGDRAERGERQERPAREGRRDGRTERTDGKSEGRTDVQPELTAEGVEARQERAPREGRRERGERGGEGRRERGERRQGEAVADQTASASDTPAAEALDTQNQVSPNAGPDNTGERRERRSRDRYGRDRRERNGEMRPDNASEYGQADAAAASTNVTAQAEERPASRSYFERAQASAVSAEQVNALAQSTDTQVSSSVAATEEPVATPVSVSAMAPSEAPEAVVQVAAASTAVVSEAPAQATMPVATRFELPIDRLEQLAQSSGLIWVNSDSAKVAAVQAAIAAEPQPVRVPRERPPAVVLNEGPLVLVETRKDLSDLKVPF